MVEFHRAWSEPASAIHAGHGSNLVEQVGLVAPAVPHLFDPRALGRGRATSRQARLVLPARTEPVAIRAHDVALGHFNEERLAALELLARDREPLLARVPMVEVHLKWKETTTTVGARTITKLANELDRGCLPAPDARDLALSVRGVPTNVSGAAIAFRGHARL
ncbi:MAG: hypothetical protein HY263_07975 [Chloroflexi bacterium]|nr:hypothetical protein [Chloroflexota bacterium]